MKHRKYAAFIAAVMMIGTGMTANVSAACTTPQIMTTAEISSKLPAPKGIKAVVKGNSVTISWKKVSGAKKYNIYYYDASSKKYKVYKAVSGTSVKISGLQIGGTYYFKVGAVNGAASGRITVNVSNSSSNWKNVYKNVINNYSGSEVMFSLQDITGDGIPELFVSEHNYHTAGCHIYTISNGEAKKFTSSYNEVPDEWGTWGVVQYNSTKNVIVCTFQGMGMTSCTAFSFKNGKISKVMYCENDEGMDGQIYHRVNGKDVSLSEFNKTFENYNSGAVDLGRNYTKDQVLKLLNNY